MRKVDFDDARANLDDDKLRAMGRNELKLTYAIFCVMEEKLWSFANKHDTFDKNWRARNKKVTVCKDRIIRIYKEVFPNEIHDTEVYCCVYPEDDMVTAREITKGISAKFDTDALEFIDDDHYIFRVKTHGANAKEIEKFMRAEWTDDLAGEEIDISPIDLDCQYVPDLWSWNETAALVKKSKVTVTIAMPAIVPKPEAKVDALIAQAQKALIQTGLTRKDAVQRLMDEMNVFISIDECLEES